MFITGSDEISKIDIGLFPKVFNENNNIKEGNIIRIKGKVEKQNGVININGRYYQPNTGS